MDEKMRIKTAEEKRAAWIRELEARDEEDKAVSVRSLGVGMG